MVILIVVAMNNTLAIYHFKVKETCGSKRPYLYCLFKAVKTVFVLRCHTEDNNVAQDAVR